MLDHQRNKNMGIQEKGLVNSNNDIQTVPHSVPSTLSTECDINKVNINTNLFEQKIP